MSNENLLKRGFKSFNLASTIVLFAVVCIYIFGSCKYKLPVERSLVYTSSISKNYYVSNAGDDSNNGTSPSSPWKSIAKVNEFDFSPGDIIHFKKGGVWRENLYPSSGDASGSIKYTSYGSGNKPILLGSQEKNNVSDWVDKGGNIWSTKFPVPNGSELLLNPTFTQNIANWGLWGADGAQVTGVRDMRIYDSFPAAYKLTCGDNNGNRESSIQLSAQLSQIVRGKYYELSFRAKATAPFTIPYVTLIQRVSPYSEYYWSMYPYNPARQKQLLSASINTDWKTYKLYYQSNRTASDAIMVFFMGNALPENSDFFIDSVSFKELKETPFLVDVGNIIFNDGLSTGKKVWAEGDLINQGDFWYDNNNMTVSLYSIQNPATFYSDIECALSRNIIDETYKHHIIYEDLHLAYGAFGGIGGGYAHDIVVRNCDINFIGGGDWSGTDTVARAGNAIEFWNAASNNLVEGCNIWEIYDAAVTNQGSGADNIQYNIYYRNNKIWNCEYSFEFYDNFNTPDVHDIYFENNICFNAGGGWGHNQRPDGVNGRHLVLSSIANVANLIIKNNIFSDASEWSVGMTWDSSVLDNLILDNNYYYEKDGDPVINWHYHRIYTTDDFNQYKNDTGKDTNSILYEYAYPGLGIIGSIPKEGGTLEINHPVVIDFAENIKEGAVYNNIIIKKSNGMIISINKFINKNILNIRSNYFESGSAYKLIIPIGAIFSSSGNNILTKEYSLNFKV
ncbi:MAG: hypothetical protein AB1611_02665 [bacterium]